MGFWKTEVNIGDKLMVLRDSYSDKYHIIKEAEVTGVNTRMIKVIESDGKITKWIRFSGYKWGSANKTWRTFSEKLISLEEGRKIIKEESRGKLIAQSQNQFENMIKDIGNIGRYNGFTEPCLVKDVQEKILYYIAVKLPGAITNLKALNERIQRKADDITL